MSRGEFDTLISIVRPNFVVDDYGGRTEAGDPTLIEPAYARVRYGLAQEKRQAAQERASQTATFEVYPTSALLTTVETDRIESSRGNWDITEVAPLKRNILRFTGVRSE